MTIKQRLLYSIASLTLSTAMFYAPASAKNVPYDFAYYAYELQTDGGVHGVYRRIDKKAQAVCIQPGDNIVARHKARGCIDEVKDHLVSQINNRRLSALHDRHEILA